MALGSKKRDFKTGNRSIAENLRKHKELMEKLVKEGMPPEEASKKAFEIITGWPHEIRDQRVH